MAVPYFIGLLLLVGIPAIAGLQLAFTEFSGLAAPRFSGLDNFTALARDDLFWRSALNSLVYAAIAVPLRLVVAGGIALLLFRRSFGVPSARAAAYLPSVIPDAAYALLWVWLLNPIYGPIAATGLWSGILTDPGSTRLAIAFMGALQIGEAFVIALAARAAIPSQLYEAAAVDGARPWTALTRITLPMMAPVLALLAMRDIVLSLQLNFVPAFIVTEGGPRFATTYLPLYVYRSAFSYFKLGYASAMSVVMFVFTAAVVYVQYRLARRWRLI
ncbi:MAG TPA: sugar ABC transporter permease [Actinomycetota bacterium]|nr:sugar ABC transporter permease [Actinomycetota bacterium]